MKIKNTLKRCLSFVMCTILSLCFFAHTPISMVTAEENQKKIPTIILGDQVWYKHNILGTIVQDGIEFIPMSVFSSLNGFSAEMSDSSSCIIESHEGYISINLKSGRYLDSNGNRGDIKVLTHEVEHYIEAKKTSALLGVDYESEVLYGKTVVRLGKSDGMPTIENIIEDFLSSSDAFISTAIPIGGPAVKKDKISVLCDITSLTPEKISELLTDFKNIGVTITFVVDDRCVKAAENRPSILRIFSEGHSIAVKITKGKVSATEQMKKVNESLSILTKQKTLLFYGTFEQDKLKESGYIPLGNTTRISSMTNTASISDKTAQKILILDPALGSDMAKLFELSNAAGKSGKTIMAMNPLTGK